MPNLRLGSARTAPTGRALRFPPLGSDAVLRIKSALCIPGEVLAHSAFGTSKAAPQLLIWLRQTVPHPPNRAGASLAAPRLRRGVLN